MTGVLLDTHVVLWSAFRSDLLSDDLRDLIADPVNDVFISAVSIAEMVIEQRWGKLVLPVRPIELLDELGMAELAFTAAHAQAVEQLPPVHRDPFDRWLIAQAISESLVLVSADSQIAQYPLTVLDPRR